MTKENWFLKFSHFLHSIVIFPSCIESVKNTLEDFILGGVMFCGIVFLWHLCGGNNFASSRSQIVCCNKYWELFVWMGSYGQTTLVYVIFRLTSHDRKKTTYFKDRDPEFCGVPQEAFIHFLLYLECASWMTAGRRQT